MIKKILIGVAVIGAALALFIGVPAYFTPSPTPPPAPPPTEPAPPAEPGAASADEAAEEWLTAFLTRPDGRFDDSWITATEPLSSPGLVEQLAAAGPDRLGMVGLTSWQPADLVEFSPFREGLPDTDACHTVARLAVVTDQVRTIEKPFVLSTCLDPNTDRWVVTLVQQPYSSES